MSKAGIRPLPICLEEITRDWLEAALRTHAPRAALRGFEIVDLNRGTCTKARLRLDLAGHAADPPIPTTVILKGGFEPHSRDLHYILEKEVKAYSEFLGPMGLRCPQTYFLDYDAASLQGIIIMEDLVARGVTFCDPLMPLDFDAVARRLAELARFHARTWNSPHFVRGAKWEWVDDVAGNQLRYFGQFLEPATWRRFVRSSRGAAASVRFHDPDWMRGALSKISTLAAKLPHSVVHCDTHLGNLYVDADGTPGFFDSLAGRAPPMLEVAYHIGCALDPGDRPRWERELVRHYLAELTRAGVPAPAIEDALHQYSAFLAFGYCVFIINDAVFQAEAVNTAYTARFSAAMLDNETMRALDRIPA